MARNEVISREAREYIKEILIETGEMSVEELEDIIRPHCTFDVIALQRQKVKQIANGIIRSIKDKSGTRAAFIVKGTGNAIYLDTCKSFSKVAAVEEQLAKQLDGIQNSHRKAVYRKSELFGQVSMFGKGDASLNANT